VSTVQQDRYESFKKDKVHTGNFHERQCNHAHCHDFVRK
jgi:hypothetical protein